MAKKKTVTEEMSVDNANVIDSTEITVDVNTLIESINNVDTTITTETENLKNIEEKIQEELEPIQELKEKVTEMMENQESFNKALTENPENSEVLIENEIKKVEGLKTELEKIITSTNKKIANNGSVTNWWNGMGYDF